MQQLLTHITAYHRLSTEAENALQDCFTEITLNKNDFFLGMCGNDATFGCRR